MSDIIEAAAQEIEKMLIYYFGNTPRPSEIPYGIAHAVIREVAPLIRADALEEAAKVADDFATFAHAHADMGQKCVHQLTATDIAHAIRTLKEQK